MRNLSIIAPFSFGLALAACGSNVPGAAQVRADFENPTGSTKSKQTVAGAYATNHASGTASGLAGNFSPVGGGFGALTQAKTGGAIERVGISRMMAPQIARLQERVNGKASRALSARSDFEACADNEEIGQELQASLMAGDTSGSFDVSLDLGACSGGELTGSISIAGSYDIDVDAQSFVFEVSQVMNNVCETGGNKYCISGEYDMEATMKGQSMEMIVGWYATATWQEDGSAREMVTKGGLRLGFNDDDNMNGTSSVEYLVYVKDENGEEKSLVLTLKTSAEGSSYEIRGSDGELTCSIDAEGNGMCSGDLSWDAAYVDELETSDDFKE